MDYLCFYFVKCSATASAPALPPPISSFRVERRRAGQSEAIVVSLHTSLPSHNVRTFRKLFRSAWVGWSASRLVVKRTAQKSFASNEFEGKRKIRSKMNTTSLRAAVLVLCMGDVRDRMRVCGRYVYFGQFVLPNIPKR